MTEPPYSPWQELSEPTGFSWRRSRCQETAVRVASYGLLGVLFSPLVAMLIAMGVYVYYAALLPSPQELYQRQTTFKSTKIFDRHGRTLYEIIDPMGGRRTVVPYERIPPTVIQAVVATEDATFFTNPGFDPLAILRALYHDLRAGGIVQGASTITQQLAKNLYLSHEQTFSRKIKEAILAAEITRRYDKQEILEIYLNEVYFGSLAYGIGAAAETYFGKPVDQLQLPEAALLAGLLQSPAGYDPYTYPDVALERRATVLRLMYDRGYLSRTAADIANLHPLGLAQRDITMEAPHMVMFVREELERLYGTETLYKGGLQVYTTLDLDQQHLAERIAKERIAALAERGAHNAALVALDPRNGDVLALLGSVDFGDVSIGGQVDVSRRPRQPGSTLKPLTYLAAFERGFSPATMLMDVAQDFPDGLNPPYRPHNHDHEEWGAISLRTALASSRNIPAVATLHEIGLPALVEMAQRLGVRSLDRPDYGLSLTLGGGEATLMEMTTAYGALANGGQRVTPRTILYIEDQRGNLLFEAETPSMPQVLDRRHAYLITDILADPEARVPAFGVNSSLQLSFPAAVKTGTTNDYRDSWAIGYTPEMVAGVWVGNNDNAPMDGITGSKGAGTIWHEFMERSRLARPEGPLARPAGIVEAAVCPVSGGAHTDLCPPARVDLFLPDALPEPCVVHLRLPVCGLSGQVAGPYCPPQHVTSQEMQDYGSQWDNWTHAQGIMTPPRLDCSIHTEPVRVTILSPRLVSSGTVQIEGSTVIGGFAFYHVEWADGRRPDRWQPITARVTSPVQQGILARWDTRGVPPGRHLLRLRVYDQQGLSYEARTEVSIGGSQPTLAPTWTPTQWARLTAVPASPITAQPDASLPAVRWPTTTATPMPTRTAVSSVWPTPQTSATVASLATATVPPTPSATSSSTPAVLLTESPGLEVTSTHEPGPTGMPSPSAAQLPGITPAGMPRPPGIPATNTQPAYPEPTTTPESH